MKYDEHIDLAGAYKKYSAEVRNKIEAEVKSLGRKMYEEVVRTSPVRQIPDTWVKSRQRRDPGTFKEGWQVRVTRNDRGKITATVSQKGEDYRLVHLLEFGHNIERNNRKVGEAPKDKSKLNRVGDIQNKYAEEMNKAVEKILEG